MYLYVGAQSRRCKSTHCTVQIGSLVPKFCTCAGTCTVVRATVQWYSRLGSQSWKITSEEVRLACPSLLYGELHGWILPCSTAFPGSPYSKLKPPIGPWWCQGNCAKTRAILIGTFLRYRGSHHLVTSVIAKTMTGMSIQVYEYMSIWESTILLNELNGKYMIRYIE